MSLAHQVIGGAGSITVAGAAARLVALLAMPILTTLLGPAPYGAAALVGTVISLAAVLGLMGIDMAYARFYLQEREERQAAVERFCWRLAAMGGVAAGLAVAAGWYWLGATWLDEHREIAWYCAFAIALQVAGTMTTTRARLRGDYGRIAAASLVGALVAVAVAIAVALWWRKDLWALLAGALASSIALLAVLGMPRGGVLLMRSRLSRSTKRSVVALGIAGGVTAPMYWCLSSADRWFLAHSGTTSEVGIYAVAASISTMGLLLNNGLTVTWFPEASRSYGRQGAEALPGLARMWTRLVAALGIMWLAVCAAGGDLVRLFAAAEFHRGASYVPWLAGGVFFYGVASLANTGLLLAGAMRYSAIVWTVGAGVCAALYALLIPSWGPWGAALAQCASFALIGLGTLAVSQRVLRLPIAGLRLGLALVSLLIAGALMAPPWSQVPGWSLLLKLPAGSLAAALVLCIVAPDWRRRAIRRLLQKFRAPA